MKSGGALIWTDMRGTAQKGSILLCKGGPGCCDYLRPISEMLEDVYQVIRFEQRGCGRSTADGHYGLNTVLMDMEAVRVAYGLDSWIVGGHSWGADLSLIYALEYQERVNAVLFMAGIGLQCNRQWYEAYRANKEDSGEELPSFDYPFNPEANKRGNSSFREYVQEPKLYNNLSNCGIPVLFLCGGQDIRPQWPAKQLHHLMPKSAFQLLPDAAHYLWLHDSVPVRKALREFLETLLIVEEL